jgi:hypothetical protein
MSFPQLLVILLCFSFSLEVHEVDKHTYLTRYLLFWHVTQPRLVVITDVSRQTIIPIFKANRLYQNVSN